MQVKEPKPWQLIGDYATVARVAAKASSIFDMICRIAVIYHCNIKETLLEFSSSLQTLNLGQNSQ